MNPTRAPKMNKIQVITQAEIADKPKKHKNIVTCLSNMKTHFTSVTVLKNQTLVLLCNCGTLFNLHLWLGLFNDDFKIFPLTIKIPTLLI